MIVAKASDVSIECFILKEFERLNSLVFPSRKIISMNFVHSLFTRRFRIVLKA